MSFQIFLSVGHLTNWTGHNLLTDNTLKKRTQDVLVTCSVIVPDHNVKLAGLYQNLVGQCLMTDCYFQHCRRVKIESGMEHFGWHSKKGLNGNEQWVLDTGNWKLKLYEEMDFLMNNERNYNSNNKTKVSQEKREHFQEIHLGSNRETNS